jgi:hypothetical protein
MTRMEAARRNVRIARNAIAVSAIGGFVLFVGLARASHPGTSATASASKSSTSQTTSSSSQDDSLFGSGADSYSAIGPSGSASPQIQTGAS